jgi:hypothetical protein
MTEARWTGPDARGAVTYTADGRFHFITVRTSVPKYASNDPSRPSPEEAMAVASGVVAYTGTYTVDESTKTAHLNIEASSVPNLAGAPNQRRIVTSITDEELKLTNPRTPARGDSRVGVQAREVTFDRAPQHAKEGLSDSPCRPFPGRACDGRN